MRQVTTSGGQRYATCNDLLRHKEVFKMRPLTRDEEVAAFSRLRGGDLSAMDVLVLSNQRFVMREIYKFKKLYLPFDDVLQVANMGLIEAIHRFDPRRGVRLITYAKSWVRVYIQQTIMTQTHIVTLPYSSFVDVGKAMAAFDALAKNSGYVPTTREVVEAIDGRTKFSKESAVEIASVLGNAPLSLNVPSRHGDDSSEDSIEFVEGHDDVDANVDGVFTREIVDKMLGDLREREEKIVRMYYGIGGGDPMTMDEVGAIFGLSRERIRQILAEVKDKILTESKFDYAREAFNK